MNIKKILKNNFYLNTLIVLSLCLFSFICIFFLNNTGKLAFIGDAQFHWQRVNEIHQSMIHGNLFPITANTYFTGIGSAVMGLYPYLTLLPFSLLLYVVKTAFTFFSVFYFLCFFITMVLSYYSSYEYNHNRTISYVFSVTYSMLSNNLFWQNDFGMQLAIVFLPLTIFGFLSFLKYNKWIELSIGVSLLLLSHVISTLIVLPVLLAWFLFNYRIINKLKLIQLLKAILTALLFTSIYWIPAFTFILNNKLVQPMNMMGNGVSASTMFLDALFPSHYISDEQFVSFTVNALAFITIFIGGIYFKRLSKANKQLYIISIILIIMYSVIFPWTLLSQTFLNLIQSPSRIYIVPQLLLDYLFSVIFVKYFLIKSNRYLKSGLIILGVTLFQLSVQSAQINQHITNNFNATSLMSKNESNSLTASRIFTAMGNNDYYPIQTVNGHIDEYVNSNLDININGTKFKNLGNGTLTFNKNKHGSIVIPYLYYNGIKYNVSVNGKGYDITHDRNHLIEIKNVALENGQIKISTPLTDSRVFSLIASTAGIIIYAFTGIMLLIRNYKKTV